MFITAENNRSLDNEACVDPDDEIEEFDPPRADNCSTHTPLGGTAQDVAGPAGHARRRTWRRARRASPSPTRSRSRTSGTATAKSPLTLTDDLPDQVAFVSAVATNGWTCARSVGHRDLQRRRRAGLAVGGLERRREITLVVNVDITASLPIANTALAALALVGSGAETTRLENETNVDNNDSTVVVSVGAPGFDLTISTSWTARIRRIRGNQLSYTVVAVNGGSETATNVHVSIDVPASGLTFLNAAGTNGFTCGARWPTPSTASARSPAAEARSSP